jgi:hypothetical protein
MLIDRNTGKRATVWRMEELYVIGKFDQTCRMGRFMVLNRCGLRTLEQR